MLTPVVAVPVDYAFPITADLVAAASRAANDPGHQETRAQMRQRLTDLASN